MTAANNFDGSETFYRARPQHFPEYGIPPATAESAAGTSPTAGDPLKIEYPVMGSPNLPVWIKVSKTPEPTYMRFLRILQMVTAIFFVLFLIGFMLVQAGKGGAGLLDNNVSNHHQIIPSSPIRFKDVQGCDEVKDQLVQVVDFL